MATTRTKEKSNVTPSKNEKIKGESAAPDPDQKAASAAAASRVGRRILVVEDHWLVGFAIADVLAGAGYTIIGPAPTVVEAMAWAQGDPPAAAVLDVNLAGKSIEPVAEALARAGIPFLVVTAYDRLLLSGTSLQDRPCLQKPFSEPALVGAVDELFATLDRTTADQE